MPNFKDLTHLKFGRLLVLKDTGKKNSDRRHIWLCLCDCGQIVEVSSHELGTKTNSCGCLRKDLTGNRNKIHGLSNTRLFDEWNLMKTRCLNPNTKSYAYYGGRGITICPEWSDEFLNFYNWAINNGYADDLTLDRKDTNGNYEPDNCRWVTMKVQSNNRRNNHMITYDGKTQSLQMWSEELGISRTVLSDRLNRLKWSIEDAFKTPYLGKAGEKRCQMKK